MSKLGPEQAAYHFISGYTAKVVGTEAGITEPKAVFSACFGFSFMPLHPSDYADMLMDKMRSGDLNVWLVNTGWVGGGYGVGERIKLRYTRAMITAALEGHLEHFVEDTRFGFHYATECPGVPAEVLKAKGQWSDAAAYEVAADELFYPFPRKLQEV